MLVLGFIPWILAWEWATKDKKSRHETARAPFMIRIGGEKSRVISIQRTSVNSIPTRVKISIVIKSTQDFILKRGFLEGKKETAGDLPRAWHKKEL